MAGLIDDDWKGAEERLSALDADERFRLTVAVSATDAIWDRFIFDGVSTFGGAEARDAQQLTAAVLARLIEVETVVLASAAGIALTPSDNPALEASLEEACHDALNSFSDDLLGPAQVAGSLVYGLPILLDDPLPVGAVLLATSQAITAGQECLLREFVRHLDTRMTAASHLWTQRRQIDELRLELGRVEPPPRTPVPVRAGAGKAASDSFAATVDEFARAVPVVRLFGIDVPAIHFGDYCGHLVDVTDRYLTILDDAEGLYLDMPTSLDAKSSDRASAPYRRLLEMIGRLRQAMGLMTRVTVADLEVLAARRSAPTFADFAHVAKQHADDDTVATILDMMNDRGEKEEVDALYARQHPYEFRVANLGEVFGLIAVHRTLMFTMAERLDDAKPTLLAALKKYQAARAFLFAYEQFSEVPLRGERRCDATNSQALLFRRKDAPSFGLLLQAYRERG